MELHKYKINILQINIRRILFKSLLLFLNSILNFRKLKKMADDATAQTAATTDSNATKTAAPAEYIKLKVVGQVPFFFFLIVFD